MQATLKKKKKKDSRDKRRLSKAKSCYRRKGEWGILQIFKFPKNVNLSQQQKQKQKAYGVPFVHSSKKILQETTMEALQLWFVHFLFWQPEEPLLCNSKLLYQTLGLGFLLVECSLSYRLRNNNGAYFIKLLSPSHYHGLEVFGWANQWWQSNAWSLGVVLYTVVTRPWLVRPGCGWKTTSFWTLPASILLKPSAWEDYWQMHPRRSPQRKTSWPTSGSKWDRKNQEEMKRNMWSHWISQDPELQEYLVRPGFQLGHKEGSLTPSRWDSISMSHAWRNPRKGVAST